METPCDVVFGLLCHQVKPVKVFLVWLVKVGGDDGELRSWGYLYVYSESERTMRQSNTMFESDFVGLALQETQRLKRQRVLLMETHPDSFIVFQK